MFVFGSVRLFSWPMVSETSCLRQAMQHASDGSNRREREKERETERQRDRETSDRGAKLMLPLNNGYVIPMGFSSVVNSSAWHTGLQVIQLASFMDAWFYFAGCMDARRLGCPLDPKHGMRQSLPLRRGFSRLADLASSWPTAAAEAFASFAFKATPLSHPRVHVHTLTPRMVRLTLFLGGPCQWQTLTQTLLFAQTTQDMPLLAC